MKHEQIIDVKKQKMEQTLDQMREWDKKRLLGAMKQALVIQEGNLQTIAILRDEKQELKNSLSFIRRSLNAISDNVQTLQHSIGVFDEDS